MDKDVQKRLFREAGLPVGAYEPVHETDWRDDRTPWSPPRGARLPRVHEARDPRVVGRRAKVRGPEQLARRSTRRSATRGSRSSSGPSRVREIECVLGNDEPVASVAGEIVPEDHEFYDYDAKYLDEHGAQLRSRPT